MGIRLHKGLWIFVSVDGVAGALSRTAQDVTWLQVVGPAKEDGRSKYSPYNPPISDDDTSSFAVLYRKMETLVLKSEGAVGGPVRGGNHPLTTCLFDWFSTLSHGELLSAMTDLGIKVVVDKIPHNEYDAQVQAAKTELAPWITAVTIIEPNPQIERDRQYEVAVEQAARMAEASRIDFARRRKYIHTPVAALYLAATVGGFWKFGWKVGVGMLVAPIAAYAALIINDFRRESRPPRGPR